MERLICEGEQVGFPCLGFDAQVKVPGVRLIKVHTTGAMDLRSADWGCRRLCTNGKQRVAIIPEPYCP